MAKKSRRSRRRRKAVARRHEPRPQAPQKTRQVAASAEAVTKARVDLAQQYAYVFTDLRRIAIIAAVMFALLFALAFLLR